MSTVKAHAFQLIIHNALATIKSSYWSESTN